MTALKNLVLGVLVWQLLGTCAQAAPLSATTANWAWWWSNEPSSVTASWTANQYASAFYGPSASNTSTSQSNQNTQTFSAASPSISYSASSVAASSTTSPTANAFINLGSGPYPLASSITSGNAQPWYDSSHILQLLRWPAQQPADRGLRQHDPSARAADVPAERGQRFADRRPDRIGRPHAQPGLEHQQQPGGGGHWHDPDRCQRFQLHRSDRQVGPEPRSARVDRRSQHLPRADALVRCRRKLRPDRQLHRRAMQTGR